MADDSQDLTEALWKLRAGESPMPNTPLLGEPTPREKPRRPCRRIRRGAF
ncbi:hypothetical protein [Deinococcus ruber]|nr:hypothetical protein [Deinococcus ruber]